LAFDVAAFHNAFLDLIEDDMSSNGSIPDVVPFYRYGNQPADPSWSSAFVFILYSRYHVAGDIRSYAKHRDGVKLYLENMYRQYQRRGGFEGMEKSGIAWGTYGEWVPADVKQRPSATYGKRSLLAKLGLNHALDDRKGATMMTTMMMTMMTFLYHF